MAVILMCLVLAAPTAGDIGSCGQAVEDLDPVKFFTAKRAIDCQRCAECGISSQLCAAACELPQAQPAFPHGCYPLVHDGEVCLGALRAAGCDAYAGYMDDAEADVPTECNFCPSAASGEAP